MIERHKVETLIDIGTYSVKAASILFVSSGYKREYALKEVLAFSEISCDGLAANNIIQDNNRFKEIIIKTINNLERQSGISVWNAHISIDGCSLSTSVIQLSSEIKSLKAINQNQINSLINSGVARFLKDNSDKIVIHASPVQYVINDDFSSENPIGTFANKITIFLSIVFVSKTMLMSFTKLLNECYLNIASINFSGVAISEALQIGSPAASYISFIDIGHANSKIIVKNNGAIIFASSIPFGGKNITEAISKHFSISIPQANRIKTIYGTLDDEEIKNRNNLTLADIDESKMTAPDIELSRKSISTEELSDIIKSGIDEVMSFYFNQIAQYTLNLDKVGMMVLSGGTANLQGIAGYISNTYNINTVLASNLGESNAFNDSTSSLLSSMTLEGLRAIVTKKLKTDRKSFGNEDLVILNEINSQKESSGVLSSLVRVLDGVKDLFIKK